jgi:2-methylfumaryl-CoA hydratase
MSARYVTPRHGRFLEEFEIGAAYDHPWEVTLDSGMLALCAGSFLDATPVFASAACARTLGFRDRPVHPLTLLNFGLSFSVHDISEQAIAHLAYLDVAFPDACFAGETIRASSTVLGVRWASEGARGVVHVRTVVRTDDERVVCRFERKVLVKAAGEIAAGAPSEARIEAGPAAREAAGANARMPAVLLRPLPPLRTRGVFSGFFQDFSEGDVICHEAGRTVSESEHMQLTCMFRNTHPLHFEEPYARSGFAKTRVVYGGLVFAWVVALASRDTSGNGLWEVRYDRGAHPAGVVAGDTLYAASRVVRCEEKSADTGEVTFQLVGTKNVKPSVLLDGGADLFTSESNKRGQTEKVKEKVFEIERTVLMRRRVVCL